MAQKDSALYKVWWILYPLLIYFLLDTIIVWAAQALLSYPVSEHPGTVSAIASIIFLIASIVICGYLYRRDSNAWAVWIYRKPQYFALLVLIGMLASHGLSALVSLAQIDQIVGDYTEIQAAVFNASPVLVIVQTVVLAPVSEELLFRGILYNRLEKCFGGFWAPALISSAIFGVYHFNLAQGIFAFLFGLLACAVYDKVRNLWASMALHIGANLLSVILVYTGFDYPNTVFYIVGMIAALAIAWALYHFLIRPVRKWTDAEV